MEMIKLYIPLLVIIITSVVWFVRLEGTIKTNKILSDNGEKMLNLRLNNLTEKTESDSKFLFEKMNQLSNLLVETQRNIAVIMESIKHIEEDVKRDRNV